MKRRIVRKRNRWKMKYKLDTDDWLLVVMMVCIVVVLILQMIAEG